MADSAKHGFQSLLGLSLGIGMAFAVTTFADPEGRPWSERKRYVWWDAEQGAWTGHDDPDFVKDRPPSYRPADDAKGLETISGIDPFIRQLDGKGWLFAPSGLRDGPLPTHYEPQESPVRNPLYGQQCNPARMEWDRKDNPLVNAPHTAEALIADTWEHGYTRAEAAYPLPSLRRDKYWPPVGRIDQAYGDRNLVCSCPPPEAFEL